MSIIETTKIQFVAELSQFERKIFSDATSVEDILSFTAELDKQHHDQSRSRRVATKLSPAIAGIEQYAKALDVLVGCNSGCLAALWGGIRVVLHLASSFNEYFEKITDMLRQIGDNLSRLELYARLYPKKKSVHNALEGVYQNVFGFLARARKVFSESQLKFKCIDLDGSIKTAMKLLWKPFKCQFGDVIDGMHYHVALIEKEAAVAEMEEASNERTAAREERVLQQERWQKAETHQQRVERSLSDQEQKAVFDWLLSYTSIPFPNHAAAQQIRQPGTGLWLLESPQYKEWLNTKNSIMWLNGIPGAGKTILCSTVIEHLQQNLHQSSIGVAYFYCSYKNAENQSIISILSSFLVQICQQNNQSFSYVQECFKNNFERTLKAPSLEDLSSLLYEVSKNLRETILIVDALDECKEPVTVVNSLILLRDSCPNIKLFLTSRRINSLEAELLALHLTFMISLGRENLRADIEKFVTEQLQRNIDSKKLKLRDQGLQEEIKNTLVEGALGMFQWVSCQLNYICSFKNDKAIRQALRGLPTDLDQTYTRELTKIRAKGKETSKTAKRIFRWLVYSHIPLLVTELAELISIELEETSLDFSAVATDPQDILDVCGSLVQNIINSEGKQYIALSHYSVTEYLVSERIRDSTVGDFYLDKQESQLEIARACVHYLGLEDFADPCNSLEELHSRNTKYEALRYTALMWHRYVSSCTVEGLSPYLNLFLRPYAAELRGKFMSWQQVLAGGLHYWMTDMSPLYYTAEYGLHDIARLLLRAGHNPNALFGASGNSPLHVAVLCNDVTMVRLLLEAKADIEVQSKYKMMGPLHYASEAGLVEIIEELLLQGANIESKTHSGTTPLYRAARGGNLQAVDYLLKNGAYANAATWDHWTPLHEAGEMGHTSVYERLIQAGADPTGGTKFTITPKALLGLHDSGQVNYIESSGSNVDSTTRDKTAQHCSYCPRIFVTPAQRRLHEIQAHRDPLRFLGGMDIIDNYEYDSDISSDDNCLVGSRESPDLKYEINFSFATGDVADILNSS